MCEKKFIRVYSKREKYEACFVLEVTSDFTEENLSALKRYYFSHHGIYDTSDIPTEVPGGTRVVEIRPIPDYPSPSSSKAVAMFSQIGITSVIRCEEAKRYFVKSETGLEDFLETLSYFDSMQYVACENEDILKENIGTSYVEFPKEIKIFGIKKNEAIKNLTDLGMKENVANYWYKYFFEEEKRNPKILEIMTFIFGYTEHSKHPHFTGNHSIDGILNPPLMEVVKLSYRKNSGKSTIAFDDNASAILGYGNKHLLTLDQFCPSAFEYRNIEMDGVLKVETHNFPTGVSPYPGAETGIGGTMRDIYINGQGAFLLGSFNIFAVGALKFKGMKIFGQNTKFAYPTTIANPNKILVQGSNGLCAYGNAHGTPGIMGCLSSTQFVLSDGRFEYLKPIAGIGGVGIMPHANMKKSEPMPGMLIIGIGGPIYPIGFGGGLSSSLVQGTQEIKKDKSAVQRGDALVARNVHNLIIDCNNFSIVNKKNIIKIGNDQGAAGVCNALIELVGSVGGEVDLSKIHTGVNLSPVQIWLSEAQERFVIAINPEDLNSFNVICRRNGIDPEILGSIINTGRIKVFDSTINEVLMDIRLDSLNSSDKKTIEAVRIDPIRKDFVLPSLTLKEAFERVFSQLSVSLKDWIVFKMDQTVGARTVMHQFGGPLSLTINDTGILKMSVSPNDFTGICFGIGFKPNTILANPESGAIQTIVEALCNLIAGAPPSLQLKDVAFLLNEMWPCGTIEENERMYRAVKSASDFLIECGLHINGGKDSLSMKTLIPQLNEIVKSPETLTAVAYTTVSDVRGCVTPYVKNSGNSNIAFVDFFEGNISLTGSALAQSYGEVGDFYPKVNAPVLMNGLEFILELKRNNLISACHDTCGDGIAVAIVEMLVAGCSGGQIDVPDSLRREFFELLFSEIPGMLIEYNSKDLEKINEISKKYAINIFELAKTSENKDIRFDHPIVTETFAFNELLKLMKKVSFEISKGQVGSDLAYEEFLNARILKYKPIDFSSDFNIAKKNETTRTVAVISDEGSNGVLEMVAWLMEGGYEPINVLMRDLRECKISLKNFDTIALVGGFSGGDVFGSAVGWVAGIVGNSHLDEEFGEFFLRKGTMGVGNCNGCQALLLLDRYYNFMFPSIPLNQRPKLLHNKSGKFESRETIIKIQKNKSVWFDGMDELVLSIPNANGEGRFSFEKIDFAYDFFNKDLVLMVYVDDEYYETSEYPFNPTGSDFGIAGVCSENGRFIAIMPHQERMLSPLNFSWKEMYRGITRSPWIRVAENGKLSV